MADRLLTREELTAKMRKKSVRWTYRNLPRLIREKGFPKPVEGCWSERAVDRWIARESGDAATIEDPPVGTIVSSALTNTGDAAVANLLDRRAQMLARGGSPHGRR